MTNPKAPRFLWQLSTDDSGTPLFGDAAPTPAIGMVEMESGGQIKEIAVAILPGGSAPLDTSQPACNRQNTAHPLFYPTGTLAVRDSVRCWGSAGTGGPVGPSRSLTIVRLDTGEIIRTFRGRLDEAPAGIGSRTTQVDFDSPITGVPVPFPAGVGEVAERIYVGDADGDALARQPDEHQPGQLDRGPRLGRVLVPDRQRGEQPADPDDADREHRSARQQGHPVLHRRSGGVHGERRHRDAGPGRSPSDRTTAASASARTGSSPSRAASA